MVISGLGKVAQSIKASTRTGRLEVQFRPIFEAAPLSDKKQQYVDPFLGIRDN